MSLELGIQDCERCSGTGWAPPTDDPDGPLQRCECFLQARRQRLLEHAGIPPRYRHCALSNFNTDFSGAHPLLEGALLKCQRYIERFPELHHGLLFHGPIGVGKTHLAVAVMRALVQQYGVVARFADYRDLLREIQDSYNPVSETSELQVLRPLLDADVLLLDELGARRPTVWVLETVTHILNDRYNRKRVTLITTNYGDRPAAQPGARTRERSTDSVDRADLEERIGGRLRSRLYEMCDTVQLDGQDFRKSLKRASYR